MSLVTSELLKSESATKLDTLSKEQLIELAQAQEKALEYHVTVIEFLKKAIHEGKETQERLAIKDQLLIIRKKVYGKSSEKRPKSVDPNLPPKEKKRAEERRSKLPSIRYPELKLEEQEIELDSEKSKTPPCQVCEAPLAKMDKQTEDSEFITVTERTYHVVRQKRQKYCCKKCHGSIYTAPAPPRVAPKSQFSDEVAVDVAIAKYADHIPIERYVRQAERVGLVGVNHQTLIEQTHFLADFLEPVYRKLKQAIEEALYLHSDETRWRMLEGCEKTTNWQLWGFVAGTHCYYDARDTRAGEVIRDFLKNAKATHVLSDAFSGYGKGVKEAGKKNAYCNAHARRGFKDAEVNFAEEAKPVLELYEKIYLIERELKGAPSEERLLARKSRILPLMQEIKRYCEGLGVLPKLSIGKARDYFLKYWTELTEFTRIAYLPIDNNLAERSMRGPVLGRKNFYGNHSKRGAKTSSILYSIIESCKLSNVEPQKYLRNMIRAMHRGEEPITPSEYASQSKAPIAVA